jgi:hypothetical protein
MTIRPAREFEHAPLPRDSLNHFGPMSVESVSDWHGTQVFLLVAPLKTDKSPALQPVHLEKVARPVASYNTKLIATCHACMNTDGELASGWRGARGHGWSVARKAASHAAAVDRLRCGSRGREACDRSAAPWRPCDVSE